MRIVLLPGLDGTGDLFAPFLAILPPAHQAQIIRYPPDKILSRSDYLAHIRQHLPTTEPYILLAESFSGPLAIELAATNPPNLKALILVATFATPPHRQPLPALFKLLAPIITRLPPPAFAIRALMTGPNVPDSLIAQIQNSLRQVRPQVLASRFELVLATSQLENLRSLRLPILILTAEHDRLISPRATQALIDANPTAITQTIPAAHLLLQTHSAQVLRHIDDFLRNLPCLCG